MTTATRDLQAERLLDDIQEVIDWTDSDLPARILGLRDQTATAAVCQSVKRLPGIHSSLRQYAQRSIGEDLPYVALMGHYSCGKSSTLNFLLNLWDTTNERATDQHPTDTDVTLITHPCNKSSVIGFRGGDLQVHTSWIDHPLLRHLVLVDTPGSGDPLVFGELVSDYLPVCDYLFYIISATNPLDDADLPLLQAKYQDLRKRTPTPFGLGRSWARD